MKKTIIFLLTVFAVSVCVNATVVKSYTTEEISKKSDAIVIGDCIEKDAKWVGKHIETTVTIQVQKNIKGDMGKEIKITQLGGEIKKPIPIIQAVPGMTSFSKGEKVLLFLGKPDEQKNAKYLSNNTKSKVKSSIPSSPYVLGLSQGKYSIVIDPKTGEQKVSKNNVMSDRFVETENMKKTVSGKGKTVEETVAPLDYSQLQSLGSLVKEIEKYITK